MRVPEGTYLLTDMDFSRASTPSTDLDPTRGVSIVDKYDKVNASASAARSNSEHWKSSRYIRSRGVAWLSLSPTDERRTAPVMPPMWFTVSGRLPGLKSDNRFPSLLFKMRFECEDVSSFAWAEGNNDRDVKSEDMMILGPFSSWSFPDGDDSEDVNKALYHRK